MFDAATYQLADGVPVRIRPVRPADAPYLVKGFELLSSKSRTRRFLTPKKMLTANEVRYLTQVDHYDHEALAAITDGEGRGIGVARYVRDQLHPDSAEVGIAVADDWQGRGVGTVLLNALHERAIDAHITRFTGLMLDNNDAVKHLVRHIHGLAHWAREEGHLLGVEIALSPVPF